MKADSKNFEKVAGVGAVVAALAAGSPASAQGMSTSEFQAYLEALTKGANSQKNMYIPGIAHATVAPHGMVYFSANAFTATTSAMDGSFAVGAGFGDMAEAIGVAVTANITGTVPLGTDGDFTVKLARSINDNTSVGLTFGRVGGWGLNAGLATTTEVSVTSFTSMKSPNGPQPIMLTAGYGNATNGGHFGLFGGIGFGLTKNLGFGVSSKAGRFNAGFGMKVQSMPGVSLNLDAGNIFSAGGDPVTYTFGVSYAVGDLF